MTESLKAIADAIDKERNTQWGDTYLEIGRIAKDTLGINMSSVEFCLFMILLKIRRSSNCNHLDKDCLIDIHNYAKLALQAYSKENNIEEEND